MDDQPTRQCGRCREIFEADESAPVEPTTSWWLCPPCRTKLLGDRRKPPRDDNLIQLPARHPAYAATPPEPVEQPVVARRSLTERLAAAARDRQRDPGKPT